MFSVATDGSVGEGITSITITDSGLTQAIADAKSGAEQTAATALSTARGEITTEISTAVSGLETKLTTGEGSLGGKVTALENSVKTINETTIPTAITSAKTQTLGTTITTATGKDDETAPKVTVQLSGTVQTPELTVTTADIASAQALQALSDRVTGLHQTPQFSVVVVAGVTDLANWKDAVDGGVKKNTIYLVENTEAADGSYVEFIAYESGETVVTEKIGTTKTDLADYAKTSEVEAAVKVAQDAADKAQGEVDALETVVATLTQTHTDDKAALESSITGINDTIAAMDSAETVNGLTVTQVDGKITSLTETLIAASVPVGTTSVEGNIAYVGSEKHVIAPEKFQTATTMPATLTSWVADLSNLEEASSSFAGCAALDTFIGDLGSLTDGSNMFDGCTSLDTFIGDLSSLTNGFNMFKGCTSLKTFIGDLSSLTDGRGMFGDGAIQTGSSGFCKLDIDSLECIANTIKDVNYREGDETSLPPLPGQSYELWLGLASETFPSERSSKAIDVIQSKGWTVFINGTPAPNE
jgi:hypothetical protein